jgi:hypothetical protein
MSGCGGANAGSCVCDSNSIAIPPGSVSCYKKPNNICIYGTDGAFGSYSCYKVQVFNTRSRTWTNCALTYPNLGAVYVGLINNTRYCGMNMGTQCASGTLGTWTDGTQYCY